jgi:hypothetical protein
MSVVPMIAPDPQLAANGLVLRVPDDADASWITEAYNDPDIAQFVVGMPPPRRWVSATDVEFVIVDAARAEALGLIWLRIAQRDPGLASVGSLNAQASPARASSAGWWRRRKTSAGTP